MKNEKKTTGQQDLLTVEQAGRIRELGTVIIRDTVKVGESYFELCSYIRKHQVGPKLVSFELGELGFHRSRISELTKVAYAADDVWNEFAARTIGFKKTLELARGTVVTLLGQSSGESSDKSMQKVIDFEAGEDGGGEDGGGEDSGAGDRKSKGGLVVTHEAAKKRTFERACRSVLEYAEFANLRSRKVTLGNGWTLVVSKDKNFKPTKKQPVKNKKEESPVGSDGESAA